MVTNSGKKYKLEVLIYRRPNFRCESLELESYVGRNYLDNIFQHEKVDTITNDIFLSFPERWLNIVEQRSLLIRIDRLYPNLKKLTIKTHSVYIIQCTPNSCAKLVISKEESDKPLFEESDTGKLYYDMVGNLFNATTLNFT